ncbi:MAG: CPBP family intramembrane metalloprotease [Balneolia bacterium]|nr:CPBP family intramembrane metalloprotease [Balneolia bacterium]
MTSESESHTEDTQPPGETKPEPRNTDVSRETLLRISFLSGLAWIALGTFIIWVWHHTSMHELLLSGNPIWEQLAAGVVLGSVFGYSGGRLISIPGFREVSEDLQVVRVIRRAGLRRNDVIQISFIAGTTEEWLFRAALQPLLGIWITSVLFVAVHGYFKFSTRYHFFFGFFMLVLSFVLGLLFAQVGLISAMVAHFVYDVWVMEKIRR